MADLDPVIHHPVRLRMMAAMAALEDDAEVDFGYLRRLLGLTDGNLGSHLARLERAGYIQQRKTFVDRKPKTLVHRTRRGKLAFEEHAEALQAIVNQGRADTSE